MIVIIIGILIALAFFFYFQKINTNRNTKRFERSRDKFEELLQRLRKEENKETGNKNNSDNKI